MHYALAFSPTRGLNNRIHRDHRRGRRNCLHVSDPFHTCTLVVAVGLGCCVSTNMSLLCICTPTPVHMLGAPADSAEQTRSGMPYWIMISSPLYPKGLHAPNGLLGHQIPRTSWPVVPVPHGSYPPPSRRQAPRLGFGEPLPTAFSVRGPEALFPPHSQCFQYCLHIG